ncbi:MAG: nitroreductase family deazaflavin-dependent oxidoreductase [Candidatus Binataceae bacterium]
MKNNQTTRLGRVANRKTLTLTHVGRKSGKSYPVTIWFIVAGDKIFLPTANVNRQWVRNLRKTPIAQVDIGGEKFSGPAHFITDPDERARVMGMVRAKYWMFLPMIAIGQLLTAIGAVNDTSGGFEVTLSDAA